MSTVAEFSVRCRGVTCLLLGNSVSGVEESYDMSTVGEFSVMCRGMTCLLLGNSVSCVEE